MGTKSRRDVGVVVGSMPVRCAGDGVGKWMPQNGTKLGLLDLGLQSDPELLAVCAGKSLGHLRLDLFGTPSLEAVLC